MSCKQSTSTPHPTFSDKKMTSECTLVKHHLFVCLDSHFIGDLLEKKCDLKFLKSNFCGQVITTLTSLTSLTGMGGDHPPGSTLVFLTGNIDELIRCDLFKGGELLVVKDFSRAYEEESKHYKFVTHGQVPINVNNVGVYFREAYSGDRDYYALITREHKFQNLTESTKPDKAFRKGIYITKVETKDEEGKGNIGSPRGGRKFKLLRCSSNFTGPTDNTRDTDQYIMNQTNQLANNFFLGGAELNHVLAQTYENHYKEGDDGKRREKKASIAAHSDKTKDMPRNGLMAFCTFYKDYNTVKGVEKSTVDPFDFCYKNQTVLTKLRFRLKTTVKDDSLVKQFDVTLYPNSVYLMSLSANRLYTHEIIPSAMPIDKLPIRMGYVIRCSKTTAIHKDGNTYICVGDGGDELIKLEPTTKEGLQKVRDLYYKENLTDEIIDYGTIPFSMNAGDYSMPDI